METTPLLLSSHVPLLRLILFKFVFAIGITAKGEANHMCGAESEFMAKVVRDRVFHQSLTHDTLLTCRTCRRPEKAALPQKCTEDLSL